jgi:tetratricopeptide (TPR) repeat protein
VQEDWDRTLYAESYLPFYTYGWAKLRTIRRGPWKYIDAPRPELYGQKRDPYELSNEVERQPGMAHDLARELQLFTEKLEGAEKESPLDIDDELAEKLAKLGYVSGTVAKTENQPRLDPKDGIPLHSKLEAARELLIDRKYDEAAKALESALEQNPSNVSARADLALALEGEGRIDEAIATLHDALELDPTSASLRLQLASLEDRRGRHEQALALIQEALQTRGPLNRGPRDAGRRARAARTWRGG